MLLRKTPLLLLIISLLFISGCIRFVKPAEQKIHNSNTVNKVVTHHHVKPGETLYSIAFEYGRDYRDVARWNHIRPPYTIFPRQKLRVVPIKSDIKHNWNKTTQRKPPARGSKPVPRGEVRPPRPVVISNSNKKLHWDWPTRGKLVSTFSMRDPGRRGIDIEGKKGQPVRAAAAGRVVYRGNGLRGYGNLIIIKHNESYFSAYAHTERVVVKENEKVKLGQRLADMGTTGFNKAKLHFEIRRNGKPVNPLRYLPRRR